MTQIMPAFEVKPLEGQFVTRRVAVYDKEAKEKGQPPIRYEDKVEPAGYLVFFPKGHSIRVATLEELKRLGFAGTPYKVDLDTGEMVPDEQISLERAAANKTNQASIIEFVDEPKKDQLASVLDEAEEEEK
jgi:hypothetical protein